jgi:drug/metabolite transporter (DMT)-like permease
LDIEVFLLVLCAAVGHATWNALIKADGDRAASIETMFATQATAAICLIPFFDTPSAASFAYMAASAVLSVAYIQFLQRAYRVGEFSHVYPLARGVAPLLITFISVFLLGEEIGTGARAAVLLISVGIVSLSLSRGADGLRDRRPIYWALGTSGFIALYTVIDGLGARLSGAVHGYVVWQTLFAAVLIAGSTRLMRRGPIAPVAAATRRAGIAAGLLSFAGSWVVVWAMTKAPLPLVSALRETGVVFAVVIGITVFKERVRVARMASIALTLAGTALLKLGR